MAETLKGLFTIGYKQKEDGETESVQVCLEFIETSADNAAAAAQLANEAATAANSATQNVYDVISNAELVTTAAVEATENASAAAELATNATAEVLAMAGEIDSKDNAVMMECKQFTVKRISNLIDQAPETMNTLNELAAALGNDPNFATSIMALVGGKADLVHAHTKSQITDFPASLPANGGTADRAASIGRPGLELCPTNVSMTSLVETGIRLILPFMANSNLMLCFTVRSYKSYKAHDIQFSGYLFPDTNQWYIPKAVMIAGTDLIPIRMGRMDDGRAYVWIGNQSNYFGIAILDIVGGYGAVDLSSGWEIGTTDETPNVSFEKTLYPNATMDQMPVNAAKLTYLSDVWGLPSDVNGASGGWIRTPGNGLLPFGMNTADGSGSVGSTDWPFRTMHAKTFHGNLDGTATNADKLSGFTAMDLIPEDKSAEIMAANTAINMHGFGYTRNGWATNGSFISFGGVGNKYHTQLMGSYEFDDLYFRTYNSDVDQLSFHPWKKVATTEDLPRVFVSETEPTLAVGESFKDGDIWVQP